MVVSYDRLTDELQRSCIRLNDELVFTPQKYGADDYFHIEIPSQSKFFRVGYNEYVFISLLDGRTTFAHALAVTAQQLGTDALSEDDARKTVTWLLENGLAAFADKRDSIETKGCENSKPTILQKANPFWIKIPFGNPDRLFEWIEPYTKWLWHPVAILISLLFMLTAMVTAFSTWEQIVAGCEGILAADNWVWDSSNLGVLESDSRIGPWIGLPIARRSSQRNRTDLHLVCTDGLCRCDFSLANPIALAANCHRFGRHLCGIVGGVTGNLWTVLHDFCGTATIADQRDRDGQFNHDCL